MAHDCGLRFSSCDSSYKQKLILQLLSCFKLSASEQGVQSEPKPHIRLYYFTKEFSVYLEQRISKCACLRVKLTNAYSTASVKLLCTEFRVAALETIISLR